MNPTMERLQRQLMEFEVMEAMYPVDGSDECSSRFIVESLDDLDAVRAVVDTWDESGTVPDESCLLKLPLLQASLTLKIPDEGDDRGMITIKFTLPQSYPSEVPVIDSVSASNLNRTATLEILEKLEKFVKPLTRDLGDDGYECLMEVARECEELATTYAKEQEEKYEANQKTSDSEDETTSVAVLRIDHMNDSKSYVKTLSKWCANLGLSARLFWSLPGATANKKWTSEDADDVDDDDETSKKSKQNIGNHPPPGGRVENVFVILQGDDECVQKFLVKLKTGLIDVDAKGTKCKERQSLVLTKRSIRAVIDGEDFVEKFSGFISRQFSGSNSALESILKGHNLLHVGTGESRWKAVGS